MTTTVKETKSLNLEFPIDLHRELKKLAVDLDMSLAALVEKACSDVAFGTTEVKSARDNSYIDKIINPRTSTTSEGGSK